MKIFKYHYQIIASIAMICLICFTISQDQFEINQISQDEDDGEKIFHEQSKYRNQKKKEPKTQEIDSYYSQRRSACLVLIRNYLNQNSESIQELLQGVPSHKKSKAIRKLYGTGIQKCERQIKKKDVKQFFIPDNVLFDPSSLYQLFDKLDFYEVMIDPTDLTANQQSIMKFIKSFDQKMEIDQEEINSHQKEEDQGFSIFFLSMKKLSPSVKLIYAFFLVLLSGLILWWGFKQLGQKPLKKEKKSKKKSH